MAAWFGSEVFDAIREAVGGVFDPPAAINVPLPRNSAVFDVETTGLNPKVNPVIEAGMYNIYTGQGERWAIAPEVKGKQLTQEEILKDAQPWFKDRFNAQFSWVGKDPKQVRPKQFLKEFAAQLPDKTIWIQNAPFESRMMAEMMKQYAGQDLISSMRSQMETRPYSPKSYRNILYVTGQDVQAARAVAFQTGDWMPVFEEYLKSAQATGQGTQVRDIQDVTRAIFSEAQKMGFMKESKSFIGKGVNILSLAYGFAPEEHRALADAEREGLLLQKLWRNATGLYNAKQRGIWGDIAYVFGEHHREDLDALKRIDSVREILTSKAIVRNLAEARLAIEFTKNPDYKINDKFDTFMMPIEDYKGNVVQQRINIPTYKQPADFDEAIRMLTSERYIGKGMTPLVERAIKEVKVASESQLKDMVHVPFTIENEHNELLAKTMRDAGRFSNWDAARFLLARHPIKMAGVALTSLYLAGNAIDKATMRASASATQGDALVDWSGLEKYGIGSDMRRYNGDFGSGWKGLAYRLGKEIPSRPVSKTWTYQGEAKAMGIDIDQRINRAIKKIDTGDWHTATSMIRKDSLSFPRESHIAERLDGITSPRIHTSMSDLMAGVGNHNLYGYGGHREFNTIRGLGHGRVTSDAGFGSPHKGVDALWEAVKPIVRDVPEPGPLKEVLPRVFEPTSDVWRLLAGDRFIDKGGASISAERAIATLVARQDTTLSNFQLENARRSLLPLTSSGSRNVGFVRPGADIQTARHEFVHANISLEARALLKDGSLKAIKEHNLPATRSWHVKPDTMLEEMLAYEAQGATRMKGPYQAVKDQYADLLSYARETVLGRAATVTGMQEHGFGRHMRHMFTAFGSQWKRLAKELEAAGKAFGLGITKAKAREMVKGGEWVTVDKEKFLVLKHLGEGGLGSASLAMTKKGGKLVVVKEQLKKGMGAGRQALPTRYNKKLTQVSEGQQHFTEVYLQSRMDLGDFSTIEQAAMHEVKMHEKALQQAALTEHETLIPELYAGGAIKKKGVTAGYGIVTEYGGQTLRSYIEEGVQSGTLEAGILIKAKKQIQAYTQDTLAEGGAFNWDLSGSNIVINPINQKIKIIDFGAATVVPPAARKEIPLVSEFAQDIVERTFAKDIEIAHVLGAERIRAPVQAAPALNIPRIDADATTIISANKQASPSGLPEMKILDNMNMTTQITNSKRKALMAELQQATSKATFRTPTGHTKGGG